MTIREAEAAALKTGQPDPATSDEELEAELARDACDSSGDDRVTSDGGKTLEQLAVHDEQSEGPEGQDRQPEHEAPAGDAAGSPAEERSQSEPFAVTGQWRQVPAGAVLPPGCDVGMDMDTGKNFARLTPEPEAPEQPAIDAVVAKMTSDVFEMPEAEGKLATVRKLREAMWRNGLRPVAVYGLIDGRCGCGNAECPSLGKHPRGNKWQEGAREDPPRAIVAGPAEDTLNTGLLGDGLRLIDIDVEDRALAKELLQAIFATLGLATDRPVPIRHRSNTGRCAVLFRAAGGEPRKRKIESTLGNIEVLGHGQQLVVHGMHKTGVPLLWTHGSPWETRLEDLPALTEDQVGELLAELAPLIGSPGERRKPAASGGGGTAEKAPPPRGGGFKFEDLDLRGSGSDDALRKRLKAVLGHALTEVAVAKEGTRNTCLNGNVHHVARLAGFYPGWLGEAKARGLFHAACSDNGLIADGGEAAFEKTFASAWDSGFADPQPLAEREKPGAAGGGAKAGSRHHTHGEDSDMGGDEGAKADDKAGGGCSDEEEPLVLHEAAFHGLAGDVMRMILPYSEADPAGLLMSFLVMFGNAVGRKPYFLVDGAFHHANINALLVGGTSIGGKGTATGNISRVFNFADPTWTGNCVSRGGLASGEGLIHRVRDPRYETDEKGTRKLVDPGVSDKRLLVIESEFSLPLTVMAKPGNTLGGMVRNFWDSGNHDNTSKGSPEKTTGAHVSVLGHITPADLAAKLTAADMANGFANRFLFTHVRRSKSLPEGGVPEKDFEIMGAQVLKAIKVATTMGRVYRDDAARAKWHRVYPELTAERTGLLEALAARAAPQVVRLSLPYALADGSDHVRIEHLNAALAVWDYCERSIGRTLFPQALKPGGMADTILAALRKFGAHGRTRSEIRDLFSHRTEANRIDAALAHLEKKGLARMEIRSSGSEGGRPAEFWFHTGE